MKTGSTNPFPFHWQNCSFQNCDFPSIKSLMEETTSSPASLVVIRAVDRSAISLLIMRAVNRSVIPLKAGS